MTTFRNFFLCAAAALAAVACSFSAQAATETVDGVTWTYTVSGGKASVGGGIQGVPAVSTYFALQTINIPSRLGGYPVTAIADWAFYDHRSLRSLSIPDSVKNIGESAFQYCSSLESVSFGNGVTNIGESAFYYCYHLQSVTIPNSVASIEDSAFSRCNALQTVTIGSGLRSLGESAFWECHALTSFSVAANNSQFSSANGLLLSKDGKTVVVGVNGNVTIPSGVTHVGEKAFEYRNGLTSVVFPDSVTSIGESAFESSAYLESVTIGNGVTDIGNRAFYDCYGLESATIGNGVTNIGERAFYNCESLETVTIGRAVRSIGNGAFSECTNLPAVTIPASVTSIGDSAFSNCRRLASLIIPANVASIGTGAFWYCLGMKRFTVAAGNAHYASEGGVLFTKAKDELVAYPCGKTGGYAIPAGVASIGAGAFCACTNLTSLTMPDSVSSIGYAAFAECTGLESLKVPATATSVGEYAFAGSGLKKLHVPEAWRGTQMLALALVPEDCEIIYYGDKPLTVWRFYSKKYKGHFFTIDEKEKNDLIATNPNWNFEGGAYRAYTNQAKGTTALYRFYSKGYKGHFFTVDAQEAEDVKKNPNWKYEGIAYYVYASEVAGTLPVYRFWSKGYKHHFYTTDEKEKNDLIATNPNWAYEKIAFYALPPADAGAKGNAGKGMEAAGLEQQLEGKEATPQAGRLRPGTGVAVTTSDGSDGSAVADGDETTGWSPEEAGASWVVLSFADAREVADVEVVGENLPEGTRILLSEDADEWQEGVPGVARYVWVAFPAAEEAPVVREIRVTEE